MIRLRTLAMRKPCLVLGRTRLGALNVGPTATPRAPALALARAIVGTAHACSASKDEEPKYAEIFGTLKIRPNDLEAENDRRSLQKAIIYLPLGDVMSQSAARIQLPLSSTVGEFRDAVSKASHDRLVRDDVSIQSLQGVRYADMTRISQIVFNEFNVNAGHLAVSVTAVDADAYDVKSILGDDEAPSAFGIDTSKGWVWITLSEEDGRAP